MRIPKKLETKIDKLVELDKEIKRSKALLERTVEYKELEKFKADYSMLEQDIIGGYSTDMLKEIQGRIGFLVVSERVNYKISDWSIFYNFVVSHEAYDLFQRRVSVSAVSDREEDGEQVPGIDKYTSVTIKPKAR